jgi:hypothetical protein
MTTTWSNYTTITLLLDAAKQLGLVIGPDSRYGQGNGFSVSTPDSTNEEVMPVYSRNVSLYTGTAEDCLAFMRGMNAYKNYMVMLGFEKKVAKAEKDYYDKLSDKRLMHALKHGNDIGMDKLREENRSV